MPNESKLSNALSIVAIVFSVTAILGMFFIVGLPFAILAIILGHVSLARIRRSGNSLPGYGITVASLVMGYLSAFVSTLILIVVLFLSQCYRNDSPALRVEIETLAKAGPKERYDAVVKRLSAGKQSEAEAMLTSLVRRFPKEQKLAFVQAVCSRSRWAKSRAAWQFERILDLDPGTLEGNCSRYMLEIDMRKNVEKNMNGLRFLIKSNPDNPFLLWLMAVVCHDNHKLTGQTTYSLEAVDCYERLLKIFEVGPVLVHQTFANVLAEELDRYDEALKHRRIAVELEPASWTYQGLANTLSAMKQYDEANKAYEKLMSLDPYDADYWYCWANSLIDQKRYPDCIEKCKKVLALDKSHIAAIKSWGYSLEMMGDLEGALKKYEQAMEINPVDPYSYQAASRVLMLLNRPAEAQKYRDRLAQLNTQVR